LNSFYIGERYKNKKKNLSIKTNNEDMYIKTNKNKNSNSGGIWMINKIKE
jgi:hypothetical protein